MSVCLIIVEELIIKTNGTEIMKQDVFSSSSSLLDDTTRTRRREKTIEFTKPQPPHYLYQQVNNTRGLSSRQQQQTVAPSLSQINQSCNTEVRVQVFFFLFPSIFEKMRNVYHHHVYKKIYILLLVSYQKGTSSHAH